MYIQDAAQLHAVTHLEPRGCTLCDKPITIPCIFWLSVGVTADIWLHPDCAASFIIRLARDVEEHKLRSKKDLKFV